MPIKPIALLLVLYGTIYSSGSSFSESESDPEVGAVDTEATMDEVITLKNVAGTEVTIVVPARISRINSMRKEAIVRATAKHFGVPQKSVYLQDLVREPANEGDLERARLRNIILVQVVLTDSTQTDAQVQTSGLYAVYRPLEGIVIDPKNVTFVNRMEEYYIGMRVSEYLIKCIEVKYPGGTFIIRARLAGEGSMSPYEVEKLFGSLSTMPLESLYNLFDFDRVYMTNHNWNTRMYVDGDVCVDGDKIADVWKFVLAHPDVTLEGLVRQFPGCIRGQRGEDEIYLDYSEGHMSYRTYKDVMRSFG